ncbi:unnamed protein product [Protopolystoma xenopodis]|uniref:Uncharacterized protein n=1 Tax=Protopolystoma xenopodis TaxID=117903 RepID=A0A448X9V2_9PLAT|nr:unnamed protein product [Protopolystoma xenopodis]
MSTWLHPCSKGVIVDETKRRAPDACCLECANPGLADSAKATDPFQASFLTPGEDLNYRIGHRLGTDCLLCVVRSSPRSHSPALETSAQTLWKQILDKSARRHVFVRVFESACVCIYACLCLRAYA